MRVGRHIFVIVSFLLLSSILENEEVHAAVFALPSNWMRPLKSKATTTTTTPKPRITDPVESQKGISCVFVIKLFTLSLSLEVFVENCSKGSSKTEIGGTDDSQGVHATT